MEELLSEREAEVLKLVAEGLTNEEIAERLIITKATAKTHLHRIMSKLRMRTRGKLIAWFYNHGRIST